MEKFTINGEDILSVYKEEGKLQEYEYCINYINFINRKTNQNIKEISNQYCVLYNTLLRWKNGKRVPYGIKCLNFLKENGLLPYIPNERTARIVGFLHGDGYLTHSLLSFDFISKERDLLLRMEKDVSEEFKVEGKLKKKRDIGDKEVIKGKEFIVKDPTYELHFNNKAVCCLLFKLGVPRGKKIYQETFVPGWVMEGTLNIQKSFLQGLFDSELSNAQISTFKGHKDNLSNPRMEMGKDINLQNNLKLYLNNVKTLLENFGILSKVSYLRNYDKGKVSLTLSINNKLSNIYHFVDKIESYYNKNRMVYAEKTKELSLQKIKDKNLLYKIMIYKIMIYKIMIYKIMIYITNKDRFTLLDLEKDLDIATSSTKLLGKYLQKNKLAERIRQKDRWFGYCPNIEKITKIINNPLLLENLPKIKQ